MGSSSAATPGETPSTRYQGSKRKLLPWLQQCFATLSFESALDAFGGTGSVSHLLKRMGKAVTYNDQLAFNRVVGTALIENCGARVGEGDLRRVLHRDPERSYGDLIARTYGDVYYLDAENTWLDVVCQNVPRLRHPYKRALAWWALFQACIAKRPYNLFHRRNLYLRTAPVARSFGNKATWDRPFESHLRSFAEEGGRAVFDSGVRCRAVQHDAREVPGRYDLVYVDPPYVNARGVGVDYLGFYHFLEGMLDYGGWEQRLDRSRKHLPLRGNRSDWCDPKRSLAAFEQLFARFSDAILVVSYRSDGIPSQRELVELLRRFKSRVTCTPYGAYQYALSRNPRSRELLIVGQ